MRLKAYEDTGLTPEEVEKMRDGHRWIPVTEKDKPSGWQEQMMGAFLGDSRN